MLFLIPSGATTYARALWEDLAPSSIAPQLFAYVLARKAVKYVSPSASDLLVAYWKDVPSEVAVSLQIAIGSTRRPYRIDEDVLAFQDGDFAPLKPGQPTLLLVDSLVTGASATAFIAALRRMEASTLVVAALLDGRHNCGEPIQTFAASVPVIACIQKPIIAEPRDGQLLRALAPGSRVEERQVEKPQHRIPPSTFASWLGACTPPALYLVHVDRGAKRHFTTYMNVERVLQEHMEEVIENCVLAATEFADDCEGFNRTTNIKVVYPDTSGFARDIAAAFVDAIRTRFGARVELIRATRTTANSWHLHAAAWQPGFSGFLVDWGAVTTTTVRNLAFELAARGARSVHAIVLTSQLDSEAQSAAEAVAAIRPFAAPFRESLLDAIDSGAAGERMEPVPVRFEFLTQAQMGMYSSTECPMCRVATRLRRDARDAPSRLLREHALRKYELLRPRSVEEVFEVPATDMLGRELSGSEAVEIWRFRQDLASAHSSTLERARVAKTLLSDDLPKCAEAWKARIRLLSAETYWLKWSPLSQLPVRQKLAQICLRVLNRSDGTVSFPVGLRWQAAFVLRAAAKGMFLDRFGEEVVRAARESSDVAAGSCPEAWCS